MALNSSFRAGGRPGRPWTSHVDSPGGPGLRQRPAARGAAESNLEPASVPGPVQLELGSNFKSVTRDSGGPAARDSEARRGPAAPAAALRQAPPMTVTVAPAAGDFKA